MDARVLDALGQMSASELKGIITHAMRIAAPDVIRGLEADGMGDDPVGGFKILQNRAERAEEKFKRLDGKLNKRMTKDQAREEHAFTKANGLMFSDPDYLSDQNQELWVRKRLVWCPLVASSTDGTTGQTALANGGAATFVLDPTDPVELRRLIIRREGAALNLGNPELMKGSFNITAFLIGSFTMLRATGKMPLPSGEESATSLTVLGGNSKLSLGLINNGEAADITVGYEVMLIERV